MKLLAITLLALFMAQTAFAVACTATCAADKCCSTTEAAATPQTCDTSMLNTGGTAYEKSWESATDKTCKTITATAGSCVKADFTYAAAATGECIDTKGSCVSLTAQTATTDKTTAKCIKSADKACTLIYASNAFTNGWTSATDFTCAPIDATQTAPKCVDPSTYITVSAALTTASTQCHLAADATCQTLTYANTAKRYSFTSTTTGSVDLRCATTDSVKCGTATICKVSECCKSSTCTASSTSTPKQCLTSATDITCIDQTASQYYKAAGDASCDSTVATKTTQCIDTTTRLLKTLLATDAFCVHTDQTCKATTTTLKQTSATDFTCLDSTATTTTTTTTGSNLLYIIGTIIFLISTILI